MGYPAIFSSELRCKDSPFLLNYQHFGLMNFANFENYL